MLNYVWQELGTLVVIHYVATVYHAQILYVNCELIIVQQYTVQFLYVLYIVHVV